MSVEKMILELFGRVKDLEEQNMDLFARLERLELRSIPQETTEEETEEARITRSVTRQYVMDKLAKHNPMFKVSKGNRASGSGLILTTKIKEITYTLNAKFYHSKSHESSFVRGWHSIKKEDLTNQDIHLHIFLVEFNGEHHIWIFNRLQLIQLCQRKEADAKGCYYFYFTISDGKNYEARDGEQDVSAFYEQWNAPQKELNINK